MPTNTRDLPVIDLYDTGVDYLLGSSTSQGDIRVPVSWLNPGSITSPGNYGADPTGVRSSHQAFTDMFNAITRPTAIMLPAGSRFIADGGYTTNYPVAIIGMGSGVLESYGTLYDEASSWIIGNVSNVPWLTVNASGCIFADFRLSNQSANVRTGVGTIPVSGNAGIRIATKGFRNKFRNIAVDGFYINVQIDVGHYWEMESCTLFHPWFCDLQAQNTDSVDNGDYRIVRNNFLAGTSYQNPQQGVRLLSGGGVKFHDNKFNTGPMLTSPVDYGIFPTDLYLYGLITGEVSLQENSFGCYEQNGVLIDFTGLSAKAIGKILVLGNNGLQIPNPFQVVSKAPSQAAGAFLVNIKGVDNTTIIDQLNISNNTTTYSALAHLEYVRNVIIGPNHCGLPAHGQPLVEIGANVTNVTRTGPVQTTDVNDIIGVTNFLSAYNQSRQICLFDQASQFNPSTDEIFCRFQTPSTNGLYSGSISGSTHVSSVVVWTVTGHSFKVGDWVYIENVVGGAGNIAAQFNNLYHQVTGITTNTVTLNAPGQTAITDDWTAGGYMCHAGEMVEIISRVGTTYDVEVTVDTLAQSAVVPMRLTLQRGVWIQQSGAAQSTMAVLSVIGTDGVSGDPTAVLGNGAAPLLANTQVPGGMQTVTSGTSSIAIASNSVVINHGLAAAPNLADITVTYNGTTASTATGILSVSNVTATQFTVNHLVNGVATNVAGNAAAFAWTAKGTGVAGAVGTAANQINNPVASVSAAAAGNAIEVVFESVKQGTFPANWSCSNAPASGTCAWSVSGTVLTCTVTGFTHNLNIGSAITISGLTASGIASTSYTGSFCVTSITNNNTFAVTVPTGGTISAGASSAVYTRDRYKVTAAASYNPNASQKNLAPGHTVAAISGVALPNSGTISSLTNPSPNIGQIVTTQPHSMSVTATALGNPLVTITGASVGAYNVTAAAVTVIDATTFQFPIVGTGLSAGTGATATLGTGTRRIAAVTTDNEFYVDTPYPFDFFQKALTFADMSGNFNKLRIYARPRNNTGLTDGQVRVRINNGRYSRVTKISN